MNPSVLGMPASCAHLRERACRASRLTRKVEGKTVSESFATPAELHKAQREVEAYHRFRELAAQLLEINEKICRARPVEQELTPQKKKRQKSSSKKSPVK